METLSASLALCVGQVPRVEDETDWLPGADRVLTAWLNPDYMATVCGERKKVRCRIENFNKTAAILFYDDFDCSRYDSNLLHHSKT